MNRRTLLPLMILGLVLSPATPAGATVFPDLDVRLIHDPDYIPTPGETVELTLEIEAYESLDLRSTTLTSDRSPQGQAHWVPVSFSVPSLLSLSAGQIYTQTISAVANNPTEPLFVDVLVDGHTLRFLSFLVPPADGVGQTLPGSTAKNSAYLGHAIPDPSPHRGVAPLDRPGAGLEAPVDTGVETSSAAPAATYTVQGRIRYYDDGGSLRDADGVTVVVFEYNPGLDFVVALATTGPDGTWSTQFSWNKSDLPDLYIHAQSANSRVVVGMPLGSYNLPYGFVSNVQDDHPGPTVNFGVGAPMSGSQANQAFHAQTALTRAWRFLDQNNYGGIPPVEVAYPQGNWPHYNSGQSEIRILAGEPGDSGLDTIWRERTLWHEYGHHTVHWLGEGQGTNYCNAGNRCDEPLEDCRHCIWCQETGADAWNEGFPSWISDYIGRWQVNSGYVAPISAYDHETVGPCDIEDNGTGGYDDAYKTEGALTALLRDIEDSAQDDDVRGGPIPAQDRLSTGAKLVLDLGLVDDPSTPQEFLDTFLAVYPNSRKALWATAWNNGYDIDDDLPNLVTDLASPTHPTLQSSPDNTAEFTWTPATDPTSGIAGYSVSLTGSPSFPDQIMDIGNVSSYTSAPLAPGTHYFNIRTVDLVGNWSNGYWAYGPFTIRDPLPPDLVAATDGLLAYPQVPRASGDATGQSVPLPTQLVGGADTWLNAMVYNSGDEPTAGSPRTWMMVDGIREHDPIISDFFPLSGQSYRPFLNQGPTVVPSGRHTLTLFADGYENMPEPSESNNFHTRQWVWTGTSLGAIPLQRVAPVGPYAGWQYTQVPAFQAPNADGLTVQTAGQVISGVAIRMVDASDDYDLRSHWHSLSPQSGFEIADLQAYSFREEERIDAVFVNLQQTTLDEWDFSVVNENGVSRAATSGDYVAHRTDSQALAMGVPRSSAVPAGESLTLFHFVYTGRLVSRSIVAEVDPAAGPFHLARYAVDFDHAALADHEQVVTTDVAGRAAMNFPVVPGTHVFALWQDPKDAPAAKRAEMAVPYTVTIDFALPDLDVATPSGWAAPLVPRPAPDGTAGSAPLPTSLPGDQPSTYLNSARTNLGGGTAAAFTDEIWLDGELLTQMPLAPMTGGTTRTINDPTRYTVRGGRHTLALRVDHPASVEELVETGQVDANQWVWQPGTLATGALVSRSAPPPSDGGWDLLLQSGAAVTPELNCDGLRLPLPAPSGEDGHWMALACMPGDSSNVDLRLHPRANNATSGFSEIKTLSAEPPGTLDYVLLNYRVLAAEQYDVGVVRVEGDQGYDATAVASTYLGSSPAGDFGPFPLGPDAPLRLLEMTLPAGPVAIGMQAASPGVQWGMVLHRANLPYQSAGFPGGEWKAEGAAVGDPAWLTVDLPQGGNYCLAVWKQRSQDLSQPAEFSLSIQSWATDAPDAAPMARAGIVAIAPNPFNPATTVHFDVAKAGPVKLEIFDVRGSRVAVLVDRRMEAGRHERRWDGRDVRGQAVSSGVYYVRLISSETTDQKKMVLVE